MPVALLDCLQRLALGHDGVVDLFLLLLLVRRRRHDGRLLLLRRQRCCFLRSDDGGQQRRIHGHVDEVADRLRRRVRHGAQ
jgi:hypothetical protein